MSLRAFSGAAVRSGEDASRLAPGIFWDDAPSKSCGFLFVDFSEHCNDDRVEAKCGTPLYQLVDLSAEPLFATLQAGYLTRHRLATKLGFVMESW